MISFVLAILLTGSYVQGQSGAAKDFAQARTRMEVSAHTTLQHAIIQALHDSGIGGGVVTVDSACSTKFSEFYVPKGMRLPDAVDIIVAKDGQHAWRLSNGAILVFPKTGVPQVLQTKIGHVHISDAKNFTLALDELIQTNEVRQALAHANAFVRAPEPGFQKLNASGAPVAKRPIDLADVSLVEALNTLARDESNAIWFYRESLCDGRTSVQLDFVSK